MIIFQNISQNKTFARLSEAAGLLRAGIDARAALLIADAAAEILEEAEAYSLGGNLWRVFLAMRLCQDDNVFGRAVELGGTPSETLVDIAAGELSTLCAVATAIQTAVESNAQAYAHKNLAQLKPLGNYSPSRPSRAAAYGEAWAAVSETAEKIFADAQTEPKLALAHLISFYTEHGSGIFALNRAFAWRAPDGAEGRAGGELLPIRDLEKFTLSSLVGYEEQKKELLVNTELFLDGKTANNVLLFGDSGTGKSSSVKALLNEPGFVRKGLRMIEVHKEQYRELTAILNSIRDRNYRFILFIDDLSFEEFEVEYKYLKAVIEGGLERKPDNAVIYATSNRRNIIREVWKDRKEASEDVHGGDTMQEKHSLAARFGVTIWYGLADRDLYLKMIEAMAEENDLTTPKEELERMALQWEVGRGGYTGRTARQFIQYALSVKRQGSGVSLIKQDS